MLPDDGLILLPLLTKRKFQNFHQRKNLFSQLKE
jgi:hypothetical protein